MTGTYVIQRYQQRVEGYGGRHTQLPFHKKAAKETGLVSWVDSMLVIQYQGFHHLSDEGALGHAFDVALFLSRVWMYGMRTMRNPWRTSRLWGSPDAVPAIR